MMRRLLYGLLVLMGLLGMPVLVLAQTPINYIATWDYLGRATTEVVGYTQTVAVDGVVATGTINCVAKTGDAASTSCSVPVGPLAAGNHRIDVTATRAGVSASASATIDPSGGPTTPTNIRISIVVTIGG